VFRAVACLARPAQTAWFPGKLHPAREAAPMHDSKNPVEMTGGVPVVAASL
jgi:hypothetical protein